MNWDKVEGNWKQFKGTAKVQWGKLTGDHWDIAEGNREQLEGRLQKRRGIARDVAKREVAAWPSSL